MLEQLEHMKKWALQNQDSLTKEQLCQSFAAMCDDAITEFLAAQPGVQRTAVEPDEEITAEDETPYFAEEHY